MEEYDRTLLALQNMNGETVSPAMKVGIVWDRLGDSDLASHVVMNAERLERLAEDVDAVSKGSRGRASESVTKR